MFLFKLFKQNSSNKHEAREPHRSHEKNISLRKVMIIQACWLKIAIVSSGLPWTGRYYINNGWLQIRDFLNKGVTVKGMLSLIKSKGIRYLPLKKDCISTRSGVNKWTGEISWLETSDRSKHLVMGLWF